MTTYFLRATYPRSEYYASLSDSDVTVAHQIYLSPRRKHVSILNTFSFQKSIFQYFFGPFPGAPGASATHFRIPILTLHTFNFSPTFDLNSHFLPHCIRPPDDYSTSSSLPLTNGVSNLWAVTHTWPTLPTSTLRLQGSGGFLPPTSPLHPYLHRHPYANTDRRGYHTTADRNVDNS